MEYIEKVESSGKLITKGCCFLCLKTEKINPIDLEEGNLSSTRLLKSISIRQLLHHLQIQIDQSLNGRSIFGEDFKKDIQVDLCESCGHSVSRFSVLFQKLEKIQLEMNYFLERIHECISQSAKAPELVQNYSKGMTSDLEALSQLAFVDNLRKQVSKKCFKELNVPRLQVILTRSNHKLIKVENTEETSESNDGEFPGENDNPAEISFPDLTFSDPPSPISIEFNEEEVKFSKTSKTENQLSPSLKPLIKRNRKSKYFTKHPSTGIYQCKQCKKESKSHQTIAQHFLSVHLKQRYKCDICNVAVFTNLSNLITHKRTCREKLEKKLAKEKDPTFKFICKICGKRFEVNTKLYDHTKWVHRSVNRFQCDLCDKKYNSRRALKKHQEAIHKPKKFHCKICNKMYNDEGTFRKHEKKCVENAKIKVESVNCE